MECVKLEENSVTESKTEIKNNKIILEALFLRKSNLKSCRTYGLDRSE